MGGVAVLHPQASFKPHDLVPTGMKSRRTIKFLSDYTKSPSGNTNSADSRRRTPPRGILKKNNRKAEAVDDNRPAAIASKKLVMGQVKILKRGEAFDESSTVWKDVNDWKVSNGAASTAPEVLVSDWKVPKVPISRRRGLRKERESEKDQNRVSNSSPKVGASKSEDEIALSSTDRLGPDPELVKKSITEFFAGSAFVESPPPSSVPIPGFFINKFVAAVKDEFTV